MCQSTLRFVLLAALAWGAQAQVPGSALPGQIERQFQRPPEPLAQPGATQIPDSGQTPPANAGQIRFALQRIELTGSTVYSADALRADFEGLTNREVTLAEVYALATKLTARYRNDGYILSQVVVPAQTVDGGLVRLVAIEGHVAEVRVSGASVGMAGSILALASKVKDARPLTAAVLERYLLLINDLPGISMRGVLSASRGQPGASDLLVEVTPRTFGAGLTLDNRGSRSLGPHRLLGDAEFHYPLGMGARSGVKLVSTGNGELSLVSISHDQWLGSEGGRLSLGYSVSRSRPEELGFIPLNLETASRTLNLTYSHPVIRSRAENLHVRATLAAHDGETKIFGFKDTDDEIRSLRFGLTYDRADAGAGVNVIDVELSQGLRGMGASRNGDPFLSRPLGRVDYSKVTVYAARQQLLGGGWSGLVAFNGQYALTTLVSSELFGFGGEHFGRGYDPSELVGDHGAALKFEVRYSGAMASLNYVAYGFYDVGQVRQRDGGGLAARASAASSGLGLRWSLSRNVSGFLEVAKPLTRDVAGEGDRKARFYAGVSLRF